MTRGTKVAVASGVAIALAVAVAIGWNGALLTARLAGGGSNGVAADFAPNETVVSPQMASPPVEQLDSAGMKSSDAAGGAATPEVARQVIRTASVNIRVDDVKTAMKDLRETVTGAGGQIDSLVYDAGTADPRPVDAQNATTGPQSATIVVRVPATKLASLSDRLGALGTVTAQSASQQDVTQQAIDLEARLRNLRAEEARLRAMMRQTSRVSEMLAVERELSRVRGEIEAMQAQKDYLDDQVAMATLTVQLAEPAPIVSPGGADWGLREALARGVRGAAALVQSAITVGVAISPLALVAFLVWAVVRARRRRRAATAARTL